MTVRQEKPITEEKDLDTLCEAANFDELPEKNLAEDDRQSAANVLTGVSEKQPEPTENVAPVKVETLLVKKVPDRLYPEETVMANSYIRGQVLQIRIMSGKIQAMDELLVATDEQKRQYWSGKIDAYTAMLVYLYDGGWQ